MSTEEELRRKEGQEKAPLVVLLVNLGTPDGAEVSSVARYLREFLMDARVIDIPFLSRFLLVQGVIAPFRSRTSAREYRKLWTKRSSPLKYHMASLADRLQSVLGSDYDVRYAMRYQHPSLSELLVELRDTPLSALLVLPLFPQYASASTGSVIEKVCRQLAKWKRIPSFFVMSQFHEREAFVEAWAERAAPLLDQDWDAFLFSYHGLPERQIRKSSLRQYCQMGSCCERPHALNQYCYRAQCMFTTTALLKKMDLPSDKCYTAFQSRLGSSPWLQPYTEKVIEELAQGEKKRVLVFPPAFVADCLETTVEIGETYKELFLNLGGKHLELVPSLNDTKPWVEALRSWVCTAQKLINPA